MGNALWEPAGSGRAIWSTRGIASVPALFLICGIILGPSKVIGQPAENEPLTSAERTPRLSTTVSMPSRAGGSQKLLIEIDDWRFGPGDTEMTMPASGTGVMTVENGAISVSVAGASKTYDTGDYWAVPAGTRMTISVQRPIRGANVRTVIAIPTA